MNSSTTSRYPRPPPAGKDNDERDRGRDCLFTGIRSVSYTISVSSSTSFSLRAHTTTVSTTGRCSFGQSNLTKQSTSSLTHVPYISTAQHGTQLLFICSYIDILSISSCDHVEVCVLARSRARVPARHAARPLVTDWPSSVVLATQYTLRLRINLRLRLLSDAEEARIGKGGQPVLPKPH